MAFSHILEKVRHEPWLITVGGYETVVALIDSRMAGQVRDSTFENPPVESRIDNDGIASIGVRGVLGHRLSSLEKVCGGMDYLDIQAETEKMLVRGVKGVMYTFDSSGGMVRGCSELANYIAGLSVPTMAWTDSKCSSAAYWVASACDNVVATEMADLGSIGVILPWVDRGKVWETEGLKYDPFVNEGADLKGAGAGPSLSDVQKKYLQETVNFVGEQFQGFVKGHRKVDSEVFRAGSYFGKQALGVGLIDAIGGIEDARKMLLTRCQKTSTTVPEPKKIQGKHMTREELQAQHPELYEQMVQEQENALRAAAQEATATAMAAERSRLAALDGLNYTAGCEAIIKAAKVENKQPQDVAIEIAKVLAEENRKLQLQVGVYKGAAPAGRVPAIDPNSVEHEEDTSALAKRFADVYAKRSSKVTIKN